MTDPSTQPILADVRAFAERFTPQLDRLVTFDASVPATLAESIRYSLLGPGKRLRPYLVYQCGALCAATKEACLAPACAIEMVHAFSLVHDDLPAMDDDDLRRGRPTNHTKYGEAVAILAGDALVTLAFETLADQTLDPAHVGPLVRELARTSGASGMIGGQTLDIEAQSANAVQRKAITLEAIRTIHAAKTGALFSCACRMGGIVGGADAGTLELLGTFGLHLGLAFQITDDLLDVTSNAEQLGKNAGKDAEKGKQTYPQSVGIDRSRALAREAAGVAIEAIGSIPNAANSPVSGGLRGLAEFAHLRDR